VLALKSGQGDRSATDEAVPLLASKEALGPVTVYVCRNFACQSPLVGADAAAEALEEGT
jgi:hypothetical protein